MKKFSVFLCGVFLVFGLAANAGATFIFAGSDKGGTGSATMEISIVGSTLTVTLDNTSPTTLDSGIGDNAPGITGFGFDLVNEAALSGWTLDAYMSDLSGPAWIGSPVNDIGADVTANTTDDEWILNTFLAGESRDYLPTTDGSNIDGALFNLEAFGSSALPGGANDVFFTTAVLILEFHGTPDLDLTNPFVRMQNVGSEGEGSLKLFPVPEPATMLLLGCGLIGLAGLGRKKFFKKA